MSVGHRSARHLLHLYPQRADSVTSTLKHDTGPRGVVEHSRQDHTEGIVIPPRIIEFAFRPELNYMT